MGMVTAVAVAPLVFVAYATGVVLAERGKGLMPGLVDLVTVCGLSVSLIKWQHGLSRGVTFLLAGLMATLVGAAIASMRTPAGRRALAGATEPQNKWRRFAARVGSYQVRMIFALFCFIVVPPFAILARALGGGPTRDRQPCSFWLTRSRAEVPTLENARRQS